MSSKTFSDYTSTAEDGTYTLTGLYEGWDYTISAYDLNSEFISTQYLIKAIPDSLDTISYDVVLLQQAKNQTSKAPSDVGVYTIKETTIIGVDPLKVVEDIDFNIFPEVTLEGAVRDAFTGDIIQTTVTILLVDEQGRQIKKFISDSSGKYRVTAPNCQSFYIQVSRCDGGHYPGWYHLSESDPNTPTPIVISQLESMTEYDVFLYPKASINGKLIDEIDQKPLSDMLVLAIPVLEEDGFLECSSPYFEYGYIDINHSYDKAGYLYDMPALTDKDGQYTIKGLDGGEYLIYAWDPLYVYCGKYYKNASHDERELAIAIAVSPSEKRHDINIALLEGAKYTGESEKQCKKLYEEPHEGSYEDLVLQYDDSYEATDEEDAPEVISDPVSRIAMGDNFSYQVQVKYPEIQNQLNYSLKQAPQGYPGFGLVQWQPQNIDIGALSSQLPVSSNSGQMDLQSFQLNVDEDQIELLAVQNVYTDKSYWQGSFSSVFLNNYTPTLYQNYQTSLFPRGFNSSDLFLCKQTAVVHQENHLETIR